MENMELVGLEPPKITEDYRKNEALTSLNLHWLRVIDEVRNSVAKIQ